MKRIIFALFLSFCSLAGAVTATFTADTTTVIPNPGRGWYIQAGSNGLLDSGSQMTSDLATIKALGFRLALAETVIPTTVTAGNITTMTANLARFRSAGMMAIVLFNCGTQVGCDGTVAQVIAQTVAIKPMLYANRDVIAFIKAGFICIYGEWATCSNSVDLKANKRAVKDAILDMAPPEIPVQFTQVYPPMEDWYAGQAALGVGEAFSGSKKSRTGFHSDCFLTGQGDSFFITGPNTVQDFTITSSNAQQRAYVAAATEFVPFGVETCGTSPVGTPNPPDESSGSRVQKRIDCTGQTDETGQSGGIMNEGPRYHLTWMNNAYSALFVNNWRGDSQGVNCYPSITRLMGYRFQYDSITHAATAAKGAVATFTVNLRNYGWSRIFDTRVLQVLAIHSNGVDRFTGYSVAPLRSCPSQATTSNCQMTVRAAVPVGQLSGTYNLFIQMPSAYSTTQTRDFSIQPANANNGGQSWDNTNARFSTGTSLTIP